jgi:hypothetical protein
MAQAPHKKLTIALLLSIAMLAAWPMLADLVVSFTLVPVTITEMTQCVVRPGTGTEIIATGYFGVKDSAGTVRENGQFQLTLTGQARTDFIAWANARMVSGFNTQRGL